jgi:hypothetical protein
MRTKFTPGGKFQPTPGGKLMLLETGLYLFVIGLPSQMLSALPCHHRTFSWRVLPRTDGKGPFLNGLSVLQNEHKKKKKNARFWK